MKHFKFPNVRKHLDMTHCAVFYALAPHGSSEGALWSPSAYYLWTEPAEGCVSGSEVMILDYFVAFIYLFGIFGWLKNCSVRLEHCFCYCTKTYSLFTAGYRFVFTLGELGHVHVIRLYLTLLERESLSQTDPAPFSWQSRRGRSG